LRVFESRVLRRRFGPGKEEMAASWRRLRDEKLHNLYASPNVIRVVKSRMIGRASSTHGSDEKCVRNFSRKA